MKTICILFGGVSSEHEVSLRSAATVLHSISREKFKPVMVGITKEGRWLLYTGEVYDIPGGRWESSGKTCPAVLSPDRSHKGLLVLEQGGVRLMEIDAVFPVLHGKNGEDGTVQGLLELAGIPYVGCGVLSSAACMDKAVSHTLLTSVGIPKTELIALNRKDARDMAAMERHLAHALGYPLFVKPANAGSSVGVTKVGGPAALAAALELAFAHDDKAVAERAVSGQEVECAVMGGDDPVASDMIGEIAPPDGVYDYDSKYLNDTAGLFVPARVPGEAAREVRELAVRAYRAMGCRGLARVDFFVTAEGKVTLNEINTIPGFTSISMYPRLFEASGLSVAQTVERLITGALTGWE